MGSPGLEVGISDGLSSTQSRRRHLQIGRPKPGAQCPPASRGAAPALLPVAKSICLHHEQVAFVGGDNELLQQVAAIDVPVAPSKRLVQRRLPRVPEEFFFPRSHDGEMLRDGRSPRQGMKSLEGESQGS